MRRFKSLPLAILWSLTLAREAFAAGLTWSNCSTSDPPGLQCTTLEVPLNWVSPNQGSITLAIARLKALDPSKRIGSLFWNPGGPGGSAIPYVEGQASGIPFFTENLMTHFDLIAMDPRGIGGSTPVKCDPAIWNERVSYFPTTEVEYEAMISHNKRLGQSCLDRTGPLVGLMDTVSVARDMEAVRIALDDGKLNFLGISYASQLGTQYAELFPDNFRAMALDGNLDHSQSEVANAVIEASTYELVFTRFSKWCSESSTCALYEKDVLASFAKLVAQASQKPIPAPGCVTGPQTGQCRADVTGEEILFNAQTGLIFKVGRPEIGLPPLLQGWAVLGQAIFEALHGNATLLSSGLALSENSGAFGGEAVVCLDWTSTTSRSLAQVKYKAQLGTVVAPNTHGASQTYNVQASCAGWPSPVTNPPRTLKVNNTTPILLINAQYDPSNSYVWANNLMEQVNNVVLLTRAGDGHTSYFLNGETTRAIDSYLITGIPPPLNTFTNS